ncbi:pancreatic lipase-related protein 2 [Lingula anatina]|uniref:Pancreatic lipase-related protein 2 n=1 Tax=Lingula anatina TaxID=7574 RepID=A0A1S3KIZ2_LINAN|nr:pancreatic lipase-related protein 2 [Lingula anatina]|eukprot:XP_013422181.1 pancreatic lipase-related protein 2 [Lingula anatina]
MLLYLILVAISVEQLNGWLLSRQVCYGELGCFSTDSPFRSLQRPLTLLPETPEAIGTEFLLYTRDNQTPDLEERLIAGDAKRLNSSHYVGSRPTKFIVHGFTHNIREQWVQNMITELLKAGDFNVIAVDWSGGAKLPYTQATANTRVVGAQIAQMIKYLMTETGAASTDMHIIGHSLGAHIGGYAGERISNMGRITALDPAEPYFENTDIVVRLDPTDADFVDVIHSDGSSILSLGLGLDQAVGHVDFYPNSGADQPGCDNSFWSKLGGTIWNAALLDKYGVEAAIGCSHTRAIEFFTESINSRCPFTAYPCKDYETFQTGSCLKSCQDGDCVRMGYHADKGTGRGSMYLMTQDAAPFCNYHYLLNITSSNLQKTARGKVSVSFTGDRGQVDTFQLTPEESTSIAPGDHLTKLIRTTSPLGTVKSLTVEFEKYQSLFAWVYTDNWKVGRAIVTSGEGNYTSYFCTSDATIYDTDSKVFAASPSAC